MNKAFYDAVRATVFGGSMTQDQVNGINVILDAWNARPGADKATSADDFLLGYLLGTAKWETNHTLQPVVENLVYTSAQRIKAVWPKRFKTVQDALPYVRAPAKLANRVYANRNGNGNEASGDGYRYRGRGLVQITGKANYEKAGKALGIDLVHSPDLALDPAISAQMLIRGCLEGWFTGLKLTGFINSQDQNYREARAVVNGDDHAEDIAKIATSFFRAIDAAREAEKAAPKPAPSKPKPTPPAKPEATPPAAEPAQGWEIDWKRVGIAALIAALAGYALFTTLT